MNRHVLTATSRLQPLSRSLFPNSVPLIVLTLLAADGCSCGGQRYSTFEEADKAATYFSFGYSAGHPDARQQAKNTEVTQRLPQKAMSTEQEILDAVDGDVVELSGYSLKQVVKPGVIRVVQGPKLPNWGLGERWPAEVLVTGIDHDVTNLLVDLNKMYSAQDRAYSPKGPSLSTTLTVVGKRIGKTTAALDNGRELTLFKVDGGIVCVHNWGFRCLVGDQVKEEQRKVGLYVQTPPN